MKQAPVAVPTRHALSIAGSDSCGGAGIQADLKTFAAFGVDGASVITAVTAQNTAGIHAIQVLSASMVQAQLDAVFGGMTIHAVKLGMLANAEIVSTVAAQLERWRPPFLLLDPVLRATSGARLLEPQALDRLRSQLLPRIDCLTPNLTEAAALLETRCAASEREMVAQGHALLALGPRAVLMKGGHAQLREAVDILVSREATQRFRAPWIVTRHLHGTGCALSAGITAGIAQGYALVDAVCRAKSHLQTMLSGRQDRPD